MMRKKHLLQNNDLIKTNEATNNHTAKVTVQYIQNQQLFQKPYTNNGHSLVHATGPDNLEIENVEYLEENPNVEEYIEEPADKDDFEDNFYPNAIHCLLDLYKMKYESLSTVNSDFKVAQLWRDIAKDMQESFFEFSERQIQHKYNLLRGQYFAVRTKEDVEDFDYFEQLHDIYKDASKENIAKGLNDAKDIPVYYKDEVLLQPAYLEINDEHMRDFKSKEIVHKEHEFIDMVEKELQAMEDGVQLEDKETSGNKIFKKDAEQDVSNELEHIETVIEEHSPSAKRVRLASEPLQTKERPNEYFEYNEIIQDACRSSAKTYNDFSFYHYNQEQERRHREKMSLLDKSLQIQERALEQQQQLLQELIKRLPS